MFSSKKQISTLLLTLIIILIISVLVSISMGSVEISLDEIYKIIIKGIETENYQILVNIRLTRVAFALIGGLCLAVSGLLLQVVLRNPMADSGMLGINSGASFATALVLLAIPINIELLPVVSFIGGMLSFFIILWLSWEIELTPTRLILTVAALNSVLRGGQSLLITMYSDRLQGIITWQNGNLSGKSWFEFVTFLLYVLPVLLIVFIISKKINVLNLSDETAYGLGVPVRKYRIVVASLGVYLSAITVSQLGMIGFVGLIVPHMAKSLVGGNVSKNLPFTALLGAILLLSADLFSRIIAAPIEIPIATVMSIIGGPFFLYLISRKSRGLK